MAETLSPNPKQRAPFTSPTKSPFFLGSNDDKLERAQARAAAIRRKIAAPISAPASEAEPFLGKDQILELFQNCIKLASENKINQKNTWELNLIDHLNDIIKVEEENDVETNFQKASCTLEAGVKIYSMRVDSVHSEAYKVLGGINRVGQEDEQDHVANDDNISNEQEEGKAQKDHHTKLSPLTTLESSLAAINAKKFDAAFVVDPLYHQTSAQFDEGGAKGLLLNNLGVYANCRVLFDSSEVPGKCLPSVAQCDVMETIDLSFAKEFIEPMVLGMLEKSEISPSLSAIVSQFDKDNRRPSEVYSSVKVDENSENNLDLDGDALENCGTWDFDQDDQATIVDEGTYDEDQNLPNQQDVSDLADEQLNFHDNVEEDKFEEVDGYLFLSLGIPTKQNAWAGPSHWKYRKGKDPENPAKEDGSPKAKKSKNKKVDSDIEFSNAIDMDLSHIFAPPKNPKSLLLPANRVPCNTRLPEDCHYQPENLVKLFLLPHVLFPVYLLWSITLVRGRIYCCALFFCCSALERVEGREQANEAIQNTNGYGENAPWDDEDGFGGAFDDGHAYSDNEELSTLVSQPRQSLLIYFHLMGNQVNKIEVHYDKASKQVDVHALKQILWDHVQKLNQISVQTKHIEGVCAFYSLINEHFQEEAPEEVISFKQVLSDFPDECRAAGSLNDISPHLCFICLLHLANEHGLSIRDYPSLDDLSIHLKPQ
ncbi:hypothetical protein RD792_006954 [Penstemon davidsonii]|uniref:Condensin complex subunit 2 n=1 Tax=Penstemon davidsonii TaxID=160366 RepID=A0ABR0D5T3_9LAMI|nr:hypothetical protein RD792_006954 [Penstemon davidsonii]